MTSADAHDNLAQIVLLIQYLLGEQERWENGSPALLPPSMITAGSLSQQSQRHHACANHVTDPYNGIKHEGTLKAMLYSIGS